MKCYNGVKVDGMEVLYIYLKHFAYPWRYFEIMPRFGRDIPVIHDIKFSQEFHL